MNAALAARLPRAPVKPHCVREERKHEDAEQPVALARGVSALPRISFGIIVFNGEPFTRYCLRAPLPLRSRDHRGRGRPRRHGRRRRPRTEHSTDGTLPPPSTHFITEEDPEHKVKLVTRDGFWPHDRRAQRRRRTAQSQSLRRAGDRRLRLAGGHRRVLPPGGHGAEDRSTSPATDIRRSLSSGLPSLDFWSPAPTTTLGVVTRPPPQEPGAPAVQVGRGVHLRHSPTADRARRRGTGPYAGSAGWDQETTETHGHRHVSLLAPPPLPDGAGGGHVYRRQEQGRPRRLAHLVRRRVAGRFAGRIASSAITTGRSWLERYEGPVPAAITGA